MKIHGDDDQLKSIVDDLVSQYKEKERRIDNVKFRKVSDFEYILNYFFTKEPVRFPYFYCMAYTLNLLLTETKKMCPSLSARDVSLVIDKAYMVYGIFPYLEGKHFAREVSLEKEGSLAYLEQRAILALYRFIARFVLYKIIAKTIVMSEKEMVNEEELLVNVHHDWETVTFTLAKRAEVLEASGLKHDDFFDSYVVAIAKRVENFSYLPWILLRTLKDVVPAKIEAIPLRKRSKYLVSRFEAWLLHEEFDAMKTG